MAVTDANPDSFRRMDESTAEQWAHIGARTFENQGRVADRMIMLLESLAEISDGFITDQLTHCLQTATMAEKAGADDEMIFDLRYTKYDQSESWWALCAEFTDDWDQQAFDPDAETYPLEHFEPLIRKVTATTKQALGD
ncbi:MAG: hypothetical protein EBY49_10155 [Actinobacteria bacterium]|nr:hypothetical protein [Actinomycetota bacterium]